MTWRIGAVAAAGAAIGSVSVFVAGGASAHPFTGASSIPVGEPATILIQIPAEGTSPMVGVDIEVPAGFEVGRPGPPQDWTAEVADGVVRYRGPEVSTGQFAVFNLGGTATRRAKLEFPLVIHTADGTRIEWRGGEGSGRQPIVVFAGVDPQAVDGDDDTDPLLFVGVGLLLAGLAGGVLLTLRRRGVI